MSQISEDMWPLLRPGQIKVTPISEDEALFSVGRRRTTKHVVLSREEAESAWKQLGETFGFTKLRVA